MTGWQSWAWHLMNDPIRSNPWALTLAVAMIGGSVAGTVAGVGGIYQMWPGEWPAWARRRETGMTDTRRRAQHAIATVRERQPATTQTMEITDDGPAFPLPPGDVSLTMPARRPTPERVGRELATVAAHPGVRSVCPHCDGHGSTMRPVADLLAESLGLVDPESLAVSPGERLEPLVPPDVLAALAHLYDPNDRESLARLAATLASIAARPSAPASLDEYARVKALILAAFKRALGERWRPEYGQAWSQAYDFAAVRLLVAQQDAALDGIARYPGAS